ncbi:SRPBCC family protein [Rubritalea marina]|uniref:SRPBCC family protein n=1 Tax=Rubritalea marina TaxID=361055 RepID=UPI00036D194E|nr:SRPBCC family protein [Rubritalea marina]
MIHQLIRQQQIPTDMKAVWDFFATPRNLERMTPEGLGFEITHCTAEDMHVGQMIGYKIQLAPMVKVNWLTEITHVQDNSESQRFFVDEQRIGPYKIWHHIHRFESNEDGVLMTDEVTYVMPFGPIGAIAHALKVKQQLEDIFDQRAAFTKEFFS